LEGGNAQPAGQLALLPHRLAISIPPKRGGSAIRLGQGSARQDLQFMHRIFVTGAAGFIGSNLVDRLLADGFTVVGWDNFSTGREPFLTGALGQSRFTLIRGDNLDLPALIAGMKGCDSVFHLAANADVQFGPMNPRRDIDQNTNATFNVLEAMRANGIQRLAFSSTGSVYGEAAVIPTPEGAPFPVQTSLYGASKVASEGLISAYGEAFGFESYIFRFVSILGERYTHGHVFDFYRQLLEHPGSLRVLGDGSQRKSYLYVEDCIDAMLHVIRLGTAAKAKHHTQIYNLGTPEYVQVNDSIRFISGALGVHPELCYTGGDRGWIGDNPFIFLDTAKVQSTGWSPKLTIEQGIIRTLRWLEANRWVYERKESAPQERCSKAFA
jgi:UDP-glucose 4-epimerase